MPADGAAVLENLWCVGVLFLRHVAELFEQRQIDIGLHITLRAGVAVPVPGAAKVAAFLNNADIFDAGLAKPRACQQAAEAATDDQCVDGFVDGVPLKSRFHIRVVDVARQIPGDFDVLVVAVLADALVTLRGIAVPNSLEVFELWAGWGHRVSERERKLSVAPSYTTCGEKPRKLSGIGAERFSREAGIKECGDRQHEEPQ